MPVQQPSEADSARASSPKFRRPLSIYEKPRSSTVSSSQSPTRLPFPSRTGSIDVRNESSKRRSLLPQPGPGSTSTLLARPTIATPKLSPISRHDTEKGPQAHNDANELREDRKAPEMGGRKNGVGAESRLQPSTRQASTHCMTTRDAAKKAQGSQPAGPQHKSSISQSRLERSYSLKKREPPSLAHSRSLSTNSARLSSRPATSGPLPAVVQNPRDTNESLVSQASSLESSSETDSKPLDRRRQAISSSRLNPPSTAKPIASRLKAPSTSHPSVQAAMEGSRKVESVSKALQLPKPAFSTHQQHFSPKKTLKAPTSSYLQPPASTRGSNGSPLSADMTRLQTELLQLHILHSESFQVLQEYDESAERQLRAKFDDVVTCHRHMRNREREVLENLNLAALKEWTAAASSISLAENVQMLSLLLQELSPLVEPDGRFTRLVEEFETWLALAEDSWHVQEKGKVLDDGGRQKLHEGLGDAWWAESAALSRRLTALGKEVETLTDLSEESSCGRLVRGCKAMHQAILDELRLMVAIGQEVETRERRWIEERLESITAQIDVLAAAA